MDYLKKSSPLDLKIIENLWIDLKSACKMAQESPRSLLQ